MPQFFIRKIWENAVDEAVHTQFVRFSRGIYENRAVTVISRNGKCKLSGTFELANDFIQFFFSLHPEAEIAGVILTKENPEAMLAQSGLKGTVKKKTRLWETSLAGKVNASVISQIGASAYSLLLDCTASDMTLKMKKKLPQPGKGAKDKVDDKYCVLEADIKLFPAIKAEFAFNSKDFRKARFSHSISVTDIILPANEKDPELLRLHAKRKGTIVRTADIDGTVTKEEKPFLA